MLNVGNKKRKQDQDSIEYERKGFVSMYNDPPTQELSLDEFEQYAIDRLYVLKTIENQRAKGPQHIRIAETKIDKMLNTHLPLRANTPTNPDRAQMDKMKDTLSHYILRMAFCRSLELRNWFLTQEVALFRHRLNKLSNEEKLIFMRKNGLDYDIASKEQIKERRAKLKAVRDAFLPTSAERARELGGYFRVPFLQALDLVGKRKAYLENGIAYVPLDNLVPILTGRFRTNLSHQLAFAGKSYARSPAQNDERLFPLLNNLSKHHGGPHYKTNFNNTDGITPEMIDGLSTTSFPMCMRTLHSALKAQHHLKHGGRMQYGLFLKGIGLQMDQAIEFWKKEFCKKMNVEEFNKKYAYNIRHNYGKEGKRKDYTPFNCARIILGEPPKAGVYHGCPFRHYEESHLKAALRSIPEKDRESILMLTKDKNYQLACKKHFETMHPLANSDTVGNHPNAFFDESRKYYKAKEMKAEAQQAGQAAK